MHPRTRRPPRARRTGPREEGGKSASAAKLARMEAYSAGASVPASPRTDVVDTYVERGPAAYFAEFFGTFTLVFVIAVVVSVYGVAASRANPAPSVHWEVIGLVHVFILFMLIQTLALISGAHFNPAVTAGLAAIRQIRPSDASI